jgi:hypothetical protein
LAASSGLKGGEIVGDTIELNPKQASELVSDRFNISMEFVIG